MLIRRARERDLPRVAEIHVAGWRTAYAGLIDPARLAAISIEERLELWREAFAVPGSELWVAESGGGEVVGFSRLLPARDADAGPGIAEISHVYLDPDCCDRGLGGELLRHVLASCHARDFTGVWLWVLEGNARARRFYEREGFTADGARKVDPDWHGPGVVEVRYRRFVGVGDRAIARPAD